MAKEKSLTQGFIDIAVAAPIAGASMGIVQQSNLPTGLRTGTTSLISVGLLKGATELTEKKRRLL